MRMPERPSGRVSIAPDDNGRHADARLPSAQRCHVRSGQQIHSRSVFDRADRHPELRFREDAGDRSQSRNAMAGAAVKIGPAGDEQPEPRRQASIARFGRRIVIGVAHFDRVQAGAGERLDQIVTLRDAGMRDGRQAAEADRRQMYARDLARASAGDRRLRYTK